MAVVVSYVNIAKKWGGGEKGEKFGRQKSQTEN